MSSPVACLMCRYGHIFWTRGQGTIFWRISRILGGRAGAERLGHECAGPGAEGREVEAAEAQEEPVVAPPPLAVGSEPGQGERAPRGERAHRRAVRVAHEQVQ